MQYTKESLEIIREIKKGETISIPFGPPTKGKITVIIESVYETLFSSRLMGTTTTAAVSANTTSGSGAGTNLWMVSNPLRPVTSLEPGLIDGSPFPPPPPVNPGNPDLVSYELKKSNNVIFSGSGKINHFDYLANVPDAGIDTMLPPTYPWVMDVTNNSNKNYSIHFRILFTGNRKIEKQEIDMEAVQRELDRFFAIPTEPFRIVLENIQDKEIPDPNRPGQTILLPQTYLELEAPALFYFVIQRPPHKKLRFPLGKKYLNNNRIESSPIKVSPTSFDGKFALRIDVGFHPNNNNHIDFSDDDILGVWDAVVDIDLKIHRLYFSVFVILDHQDWDKITIQTRVNRAWSYFDKRNEVSVAGKSLPHFSGDDFNTKVIGMMEESIDTAINEYLSELNRNRDEPIYKTLIKTLFGDSVAANFLGYEQRLWITYAGDKPSVAVNEGNISGGVLG